MNIQIDPHTLERAEERGASADEIGDVIVSGISIPVKYGRLGKTKTYEFKKNRLGKYYEHKKVEVFFVVEGDVTVTITVYDFYGKWEIDNGNSV
jgi:mannose-6-phosphate isomerase-like protein (cupin superfamily)